MKVVLISLNGGMHHIISKIIYIIVLRDHAFQIVLDRYYLSEPPHPYRIAGIFISTLRSLYDKI